MTLVLQWRRPDPVLATRWRGPDDAMLATITATPYAPVAAIIGPPGPSGGGGGGAIGEVEVDLGPIALRSGRFVFGGQLGVASGAPVLMTQAPGPYSGKGTRADEAEMDAVTVAARATAAGTITGYWRSATRVRGAHRFTFQAGS